MRKTIAQIALAATVVTSACGTSAPDTKSQPASAAQASAIEPAPSREKPRKVEVKPPERTGPLFERLGGEPAITAVVDAFLKRVAADKRINGRFINTDLGRLRGLLIQFVSSATGGKVEYTGRDMHTTHAGLQIIDEEFDALVEDLAGALAELHVPAKEQGELLGALGPLKPKVVNPPPASAAAHDPALVERARALVTELRGAGDDAAAVNLLEVAITARTRGQLSYADQLFSAAERQLPAGKVEPLVRLFREGAPERITSDLKKMPESTPPQPKLSAGNSDEDAAAPKVPRASLNGKLTIVGGTDVMGVIALDRLTGKSPARTPKQRVMEQRDRQFAPRLLAIPVGSTVSFPNFDPVFHNVFSLSPARAFDLGIYKNGESREVKFQKEGLIRMGCNLHANMAAHVVVVAAAHYVVTSPKGDYSFRSLPPGKYRLRAWSEDSGEPVTRTVEIHRGPNTLDFSIPRGSGDGLGTDKFGVPRSEVAGETGGHTNGDAH